MIVLLMAGQHTSLTSGIWTLLHIAKNLNIGYIWMVANCVVSAAYVRIGLCTQGWKALRRYTIGLDDAQADKSDWLFGLGFYVLQQPALRTRACCVFLCF